MAQNQHRVALLVLDGMADFVAGDGDGRYGAFVVHRLRQPDDAMNRVVVVAEASWDRFDRHIVEAVGIQHAPGGLVACHAAHGRNFSPAVECALDPELSPDREAEGDQNQEVHRMKKHSIPPCCMVCVGLHEIAFVQNQHQRLDAGGRLRNQPVESLVGLLGLEILDNGLKLFHFTLELAEMKLQITQLLRDLGHGRDFVPAVQRLLDFIQRIFVFLHLFYTLQPFQGFNAVEPIIPLGTRLGADQAQLRIIIDCPRADAGLAGQFSDFQQVLVHSPPPSL
ncbi:hypothetical protein BN871_AU_00070 [Paenibacillus sp. P22]|nr:hypothetical protein BN871_AU_00070 [Paenibacillus sp. P22]